MAYTSDFRFKNYIKDIDHDVRIKLQEQGIEKYPDLRIFEESHEDSILFDKGGLTFTFPGTNIKFGSNDAGWCVGQEPLVIVEGTYGTERGQFGDGQLNRFSHSTGVAINGYIGITLTPFYGESYATNGTTPIGLDESIKLKYAKIHKGFIKGAITVNKTESGKFLAIDIYDRDLIVNVVVEAFKEKLGLGNNLNNLIQRAIGKMEDEVRDFSYAERSNQFLKSLYGQDGKLLSSFSRMYTQNFDALTKSEKRDGHGLFGKNLVESYLSGDDNYYAIFIRMNAEDIANLTTRNQKEFTFLLKSKKINVRCLDDLIFSDPSLKERARKIKQVNLLHSKQTELIKELNLGFTKKQILLRH
jgi:hypothetical protein